MLDKRLSFWMRAFSDEADAHRDAIKRADDIIQRAATLLQATTAFIDKNPVKEYTVFYDEAHCDGNCLREDCRLLLKEMEEK